MIFEKYYCIKQYDIKDCGAACIATISKQYGLKTPITKIREIAGTDRNGTNVYGLIKAAEKLGFTAKAVRGEQKAFFSGFPLLAIAHVGTHQELMYKKGIYYELWKEQLPDTIDKEKMQLIQ